MTKPIDMGNICLYCGEDSGFGSGRYVNRIPATTQDGADAPEYDGYMCGECVAEAEAELRAAGVTP